MGVADSDGLNTFLHDASREDRTVTVGEFLADDPDVIAGVEFKMISLEQPGIAEMNVHLAGGCLQKKVGTDRRQAGSSLELDDRAKESDFTPRIIGLMEMSVGLRGLLRANWKAER